MLSLWWLALLLPTVVHHSAHVTLMPQEGRIAVEDTVVGLPRGTVWLALHGQLIPDSLPTGEPSPPWDVGPVARAFPWEVTTDSVVFRYEGVITHAPEGSEGYARGFATSPGVVDSQGVFLSGSSYWLPTLQDAFLTFTLRVKLPPGWDCVSQGQGSYEAGEVVWRCGDPMEEAYLVAGPFVRFSARCHDVEAQAYLREADTTLATTYLEATCRYLALYEGLLGPYPYTKFAVVENFWETGLGMPSFTLLGPTVMRLPFIVHTSLGHEILHNWFGNGVYVASQGGNWCEGLTTYLSDHLYKEAQGQGAEYRFTQLRKYAWYGWGRDEPLAEFTERHSPSSEAVGYGKSSMVFHMLRRGVGDSLFFAALRSFCARHLFQKASWDDLRQAFEGACGLDLSHFFSSWVDRPGAARLRVREARPVPGGIRVVLEQASPPYPLWIPVRITWEADGLREREMVWAMGASVLDTVVPVPGVPLSVHVDPSYEVMRVLAPDENPPALGAVFSADTLFFEPSAWDSCVAAAWPLPGQLVRASPGAGGPRLVVGGEVLADSEVAQALRPFVEVRDGLVMAGGDTLAPHLTVVAVVATPRGPLCWIRPGEGLREVLRKLVHYEKYGLVAFDRGRAVTTRSWPVRAHPLRIELSGGG